MDPGGHYTAVANVVQEDLFEVYGGSPLMPFVRKFAKMALSSHPPALYLDGAA